MRASLALLGFFLSGAAGLMAEVCWIRRASFVFGSTIYATSSVVAVFFLGLAAGAWTFGRVSLRTTQPLRLYVLLEVMLAVLVAASPAGFGAVDSAFGAVYRATGGASGGATLWLARFALVAAVVFLPAFAMGGTLPLFCRHFTRAAEHVGRTVGALYALNTLGAAAGCALAGFVLVPSIGVRRTLFTAAATGLTAAILNAVSQWSQHARVPVATASSARDDSVRQPDRAIVTALFFATGFVALGHEVLWTRFLALLVPATVHTYTLSLTTVLAGIVLGSLAGAWLADRVTARARWFGALQVASALTALATLHLPPPAWLTLGSAARTAFVFALVPAMFSGAAFPLAVRMVTSAAAQAGRTAGGLAAANTLGGIAGALAVGFVLLPRLGLAASALATTGVGLLSGAVAWLALDRAPRPALRVAGAIASAGAWLLVPRLLPARVPADFLADRVALVDFHEGLETNLAVVRKAGVLQLEADRWWQGQDRKTHQIMAAHVPMLLHSRPRRVLVVGAGAGQTPERALLYDIERLDCVDIEPSLFAFVGRHFPGEWMRDPRTHLLHEDGRNYVAHAATRYDVIALEVGQVFRPGAEAFYTADFYRSARARLEPGGVLSQFVPLPFLEPAMFRRVLASFLEVFPQSILWYNTAECLLLGVNASEFRVDPARLDLLTTDAGIHGDLRYSQWNGARHWLNQPHVFLGGFLCGPRGLGSLAAGAEPLRDDLPVLAESARRVPAEAANDVVLRDLIRTHLEPVASVLAASLPDSVLAGAAAVRERNLADVAASAALRRVEPLQNARRTDELEALLRGALAANPENVQALRLLGDVLLLRGRISEAEPVYARAVALQSGDAAAHFGLARALHVQRRFDAAIAQYQAGLALDPADADAHNNLAAAYAEQGALDDARRHFRRALELRPDFPDARRNLTRLEARQPPVSR